jgi:hypothetical protein
VEIVDDGSAARRPGKGVEHRVRVMAHALTPQSTEPPGWREYSRGPICPAETSHACDSRPVYRCKSGGDTLVSVLHRSTA